ncbi:MAG: excalibur calcium-binding domain-containing protein [Methylacidiphilales bacterium]|nr:excalibur calcium-binding domain-containing protein [Candidatus Methylacidiphilales bacterium]NJR15277.1 excalibur calcium-binding domain-containing protein [Calothrix sp. CSU_2_0]
MKRLLSFLGWAWVAFCFIGVMGLISKGEVVTAIMALLWGLIFLPPLWRLTSRYGLAKNVIGRIILFVMVPVIFPSPPQNQSVKPVEQVPQAITSLSSANATPTTTSTVVTNPSLELKSAEEAIERYKNTPNVVANPSLQAIPSPNITDAPLPTPATVATPKPAITPEQRVYIPVYQNPIVQKELTASPTQTAEAQTKRETKPTPKPQQAKQIENQTLVTNGSAIPSQSGSCKNLRARGIENIDVKANPWAKRLDRDDDGVACEAN